MLSKLRERTTSLINNTTDEIKLEKYKLIEEILKNDNCFLDMDTNTAINLLVDLNFTKEQAMKIYLSILNNKNYML